MVRDLNDRVYALCKDLKARHAEFDCECGDRNCGRSVALTLAEYVAIRARGGAVLSPEHAGRGQRRPG